jgi:hypothetical protein
MKVKYLNLTVFNYIENQFNFKIENLIQFIERLAFINPSIIAKN